MSSELTPEEWKLLKQFISELSKKQVKKKSKKDKPKRKARARFTSLEKRILKKFALELVNVGKELNRDVKMMREISFANIIKRTTEDD